MNIFPGACVIQRSASCIDSAAIELVTPPIKFHKIIKFK